MARVLKWSHSFTYTSRIHPLTEWTIPAFTSPVLIYGPRSDGKLSWLCVGVINQNIFSLFLKVINVMKWCRISDLAARRPCLVIHCWKSSASCCRCSAPVTYRLSSVGSWSVWQVPARSCRRTFSVITEYSLIVFDCVVWLRDVAYATALAGGGEISWFRDRHSRPTELTMNEWMKTFIASEHTASPQP